MKRTAWRWMAFGFALVLLSGALAGCGGAGKKDSLYKGSGETVLQYWTGFTGPDGQGMQVMVDQFNAEFKGKIKVEMQVLPWGEYHDKIVTAVAAGKAPDMGVLQLDNVAKFADKGVLATIDDRVAELGLEEKDFSPPVWRAGVYQGKRYAVPLDVHPMALYYNKDLLKEAGFDKPPTTWDEFITMAKAATKDTNGDGKPDQWGYMLPKGWPHGLIFWAALHQQGGTAFDASVQAPAFNSDAGVKAMQQLVDLIEVHQVSPPNVPVDGGYTAFRQGKALFHLDGIWMLQGMKEQQGLNFDVAVTNSIFGDKKAVWAGSHQFVVFKQKNPDKNRLDAAVTFINWVTKNSVEWAKYGQIPARSSARESDAFKALTHQSILAQQMDYVVFMPTSPKAGDAYGPAWEAFDLVLDKKKSVKQALDEGADKALKALKAE